MKIISNEFGRTSRAFITDEIRPDGGMNVSELVRAVTERYQFSIPPSIKDTIERGAVFQGGSFDSEGQKINIQTLALFNNGISVTASNTDMADVVLEDAVSWLMKTFNTREPISKPTTRYDNHIVVEFDPLPEKALKIFDAFKGVFERVLQKTYGEQVPIHFTRLWFGADPLTQAPHIIRYSDFAIERRTGHLYSENRYFSMAPLQTQDHIEVLSKFEEFLRA